MLRLNVMETNGTWLGINGVIMASAMVICDQVWENRSYPHILYFEKYEFEILNALFFSCGTIQSCQICCINSAVI